MPGGDRTGPLGMGPRTGRGAGFCSGYNMPGYVNPVPVRGFCGGFGPGVGRGGRGYRNWFRATGLPGWQRSGLSGSMPERGIFEPDVEKQMLEQEARGLQSELDRIKKRLDEISSANKEDK